MEVYTVKTAISRVALVAFTQRVLAHSDHRDPCSARGVSV
jgi:hypothetical protein